MKLHNSKSRMSRGRRAFTLVEAMVASVTLIILIGSVIMCNLFGLAMATRQQIWLGASDDAAQAVGALEGDIRSAIAMEVGTFQTNVFTITVATNQQSGNALVVFTNSTATLATGPWVLYYYDSTSNNLVRSNFYGVGIAGDSKYVSANPITNDSTHPIFTELDSSGTGTPISNSASLAPVSIYLSFTKLQNPQIVIESGSLVDLYQITITAFPRAMLSL
jgi:Tfp pilus assembly protein PilW